MIALLIYLVVFCILFGTAYLVITRLLPAPIQNVALVLLYVVGAIVACAFLLSLVGVGPGFGNLPSLR